MGEANTKHLNVQVPTVLNGKKKNDTEREGKDLLLPSLGVGGRHFGGGYKWWVLLFVPICSSHVFIIKWQ